MNNSAIEYCDHTLNIVTGCLNDCPYCYARRMVCRFSGDTRFNVTQTDSFRAYPGVGKYKSHTLYELDEPFKGENGQRVAYPFGFDVTFHRYRFSLLDRLKGGSNIFVGAMSDTFGPWVPEEWIVEILERCQQHQKNNYLFLTKFPERYQTLHPVLPMWERFWYGTTVTQNKDLRRIDELPVKANTFLSIEPLLEDLFFSPEDLRGIRWVIIGAETGRRAGKVKPEFEWVKRIVLRADNFGIPVFMKDSMIQVVGGEQNMRREYPRILTDKPLSDRMQEILTSECIECRNTFPISSMVSLQARVGRHDQKNPTPTKVICKMCRSCYTTWCRYHKLDGYVNELYGDSTQEESNG